MITFDFGSVLSQWPLLAKGVANTVWLTTVATLIGVAVGIAGAWARTEGPAVLSWLVGAYVELIRNTPFIVQLFFVFFGLPAMGIKLSPEVASILAMVINLGAYSVEIIRAGISSVKKGQVSAGQALGLTNMQTMRYVVLPQAIRNMIPVLLTQSIVMLQDTSLVYVVGLRDFLTSAEIVAGRDSRPTELYIFVALVFLVICFLGSRLANRMRRSYAL